MKRIIWVLLLMLFSCSNELRVYSDYDRDFDLKQYRTFQWATQKDIEGHNNPLYYNELIDKRIKKLAGDQLQLKGIGSVTQDPDATVHYHIVVDDKFSVTPDPYGLYGAYWSRTGANVVQYKEGTLIIDLMDSKTNNLVWRGYAVSITEGSDNEITEVRLTKAIVKIFEQFRAPKN